MEQFITRKDKFNEVRKAIFIRVIPMVLLASAAGFIINQYNSSNQPGNIYALLFTIPIFLGALAFGLNKAVNAQRQLFESFSLTVFDDSIKREQVNTPTITLLKTDIKEILKKPDGNIIIKGKSMFDAIIIPAQIEEYEKLSTILNNIKPITSKESLIVKFRKVLAVLAIGLMVAVYISKDKLVVGVSGVLILILLGYSFLEFRRNKNIDETTKGSAWILIPVFISIISVMYFKLF